MIEHVIHTTIPPSHEPICGAADPGPVPFGQPFKIAPCADCMHVGPEGLPRELRMEHHLGQVRTALRQKLRGLSAGDREAWVSQIVAVASSGLADPDAAPALYDLPQLLAALYQLSAVRAAFWQLKRAGVRPTWSLLERGLVEMEMITVALVEGTPA